MNFASLVRKEILHRKTGFVIGLTCVSVAVGSFVGAFTLLRAHETRTEQILADRERETRVEMERLEDDYRRIMRALGHNVMILHEDQSRAGLRAKGHPDTTMPEAYTHKLAEGHIETLNHLLPVLQQRITWPEHDLEILLMGTPGQVPVRHLTRFLTDDGEAYRNPLVATVPEGFIKIGHAVADALDLRPGDSVELMGETFEVQSVGAQQGSQEDIMVWCNLDRAQEWLDRKGLINVIFALECICDIDGLGLIQEEVNGILPDVQVLEFSSRVIARGEARKRAEEEAKRAIAAEIRHRQEMGEERRAFAAVLVPLVLLASGLWVFFLVLGNVREREAEIGILRAIGVRESVIVGVFLCKALLMGLVGAVAGYVLGVAAGSAWGGVALFSAEMLGLFSPRLFLAALLVSLVLCAVAGWVPAMMAAHRDPADVLRKD